MDFLVNINLHQNELDNAVIQPLAVAPANAKQGQIYFNTTDKTLYQYSGTAWTKVGVVYNQASSTGAVVTGLDSNGNVTPTNVIDLTLDGYEPVEGGYIAEGDNLATALQAMDTAIKNAVAGGGEVNQNAWSNITVGDKTVQATAKTDTFSIAATGPATVSANTANKTITVGVNVDASLSTTSTNPVQNKTVNTAVEGAKTYADNAVTIKEIAVNNQTLTPDSSKKVNIAVPTKTSDLENDDGFISSIPSEYITETELDTVLEDYLPLEGGTMSGNIAMGSHRITGLTSGTDDNDAVNKKQLDDAIAGIGTVFNLKGSVATVESLPQTDNKIGDVYYVESVQAAYIWLKDTTSPNGRWEEFGEPIDLSGYLKKADLSQSTGSATDNTMSQNAITQALNNKADSSTVEAIPVVKTAIGTITTSLSTVTINYTGTVIGTFVKNSSGEEVIVDTTINTSNVVFTCSATPTVALTCIVVYI